MDEVEKLKSKIQSMEDARKEDGVDREKFYDGASWLAQQALIDCEDALRRLDGLKADYRKRLSDAGSDSFMRERLSEWVLDSSERIVKETKDKVETRLRDSTRNLN